MKKRLPMTLSAIALAGCLFGCSTAEYTVTFDDNYSGQTLSTQTVQSGKTVQEVQPLLVTVIPSWAGSRMPR